MGSSISDEEGLCLDIRFALGQVEIVRSRNERNDERWRESSARTIVDKLKRSNWDIRRKPGATPHSTPVGKDAPAPTALSVIERLLIHYTIDGSIAYAAMAQEIIDELSKAGLKIKRDDPRMLTIDEMAPGTRLR